MNIALRFAYDGHLFHGYARQPNLRTVEGEIIKILFEKKIINDIKSSNFRSASRTDKAVSALCNVLAFKTELSAEHILNILSNCSKDIVFYGYTNTKDDFNPRYAKMRLYRYFLKKEDFNLSKFIKCASFFTAEHDFSNFARVETGKNPVRTIENIVIKDLKYFLCIDFYASNFLWQQIRRIICVCLKFAKGKVDEGMVLQALKNPEKKIDFGVVSGKGLFLYDIFYGFDFVVDKNLFDKAKRLEKNIISSL